MLFMVQLGVGIFIGHFLTSVFNTGLTYWAWKREAPLRKQQQDAYEKLMLQAAGDPYEPADTAKVN